MYTTQVWLVALEEPRRAGEIRIVGRLVRARLSSWSLGSISAWLGSCPRTECPVFAMEPSLALHLPSPVLASEGWEYMCPAVTWFPAFLSSQHPTCLLSWAFRCIQLAPGKLGLAL